MYQFHRYAIDDIQKRCKIYTIDTRCCKVGKFNAKEYEKYLMKTDEATIANTITFKVAEVSNRKQSQTVVCQKYEGGYAIWESTWVFLVFLHLGLPHSSGIALEIGCGNGLAGLLAVSRGYSVLFQDLNYSVLKEALLPNYILNFVMENEYGQENHVPSTHKTVTLSFKEMDTEKDIDGFFYYTLEEIRLNGGSKKGVVRIPLLRNIDLIGCEWNELAHHSSKSLNDVAQHCDLILSSECLYRSSNYETLAMLLHMYLKEDGVAYFATKRVYFGMSGGTFDFMDYIGKFEFYPHTEILSSKIVHSMTPFNSSNVIDIIEIRKQRINK